MFDTIKWFLARSDVEAAVALLNQAPRLDTRWGALSGYMRELWPSAFGKYEHVYETAGAVEAKVPLQAVLAHVRNQWRYQVTLGFLGQALPGHAHVLDFGCSRAAHAVNFHNDLGNKKFTCMDIDPVSIVQAQELIDNFARYPSMFNVCIADETEDLPEKQFDATICFELLEHVIDPYALIAKLESTVKDGGWMIFSLPHGPVELPMWVEHPDRLREHIREFSLDDILDVFGRKSELLVQYMKFRRNPYLPDMHEGSHFIAYRVGGQPTGEIDMERKLSTRRVFTGELPGYVGP